MIKLAVVGATGRMGTRVLALAAEDDRFEAVAALTGRDDPKFGVTIPFRDKSLTATDQCEADFDVMVDFSIPAGTMAWLPVCVERNKPMVIGPTGFTDEQLAAIDEAGHTIPVLKATNFSLGVNLLLSLVADAASKLGDGYDIEIIEHHHNRKVDAPSGTAKSLLHSVLESTGRDRGSDVIYGREGETGLRPPREVGVHAVRMGDVVGLHEVHFGGQGESVMLQHRATSRDTFASGALRAAEWLVGQGAGRYDMRDVLGLR